MFKFAIGDRVKNTFTDQVGEVISRAPTKHHGNNYSVQINGIGTICNEFCLVKAKPKIQVEIMDDA